MKKKKLGDDKVRVIKISKDALFEFIYENFIDDQDVYFDVDPLAVTSTFSMDYDNCDFIFCVSNTEDALGNLTYLHHKIDPQKLLQKLPDTTSTMFADGRYREYTIEELETLSKEAD